MILTFDIGNTNIKVALFENKNLTNERRISSDSKKTGDEYFALIRGLFRDDNIDISEINLGGGMGIKYTTNDFPKKIFFEKVKFFVA